METARVLIMQGERKAIHVSDSGSSFAGIGFFAYKIRAILFVQVLGS